MKTFEQFLQEAFDRNYGGTKDQVEEAYAYWLENQELAEIMEWAEFYGKECFLLGKITK